MYTWTVRETTWTWRTERDVFTRPSRIVIIEMFIHNEYHTWLSLQSFILRNLNIHIEIYLCSWSFDTGFFSGMAYILFIGYMSMHLVLRVLSNPNISIGLHRCYLFLSEELIITWYYNYRLYFIYVWVCLFLCSAHIELGH